MDLNEALAFATNAVPAPVQPTPQGVQQQVVNNANVQAAAQVIQPTASVVPPTQTITTTPAPVQPVVATPNTAPVYTAGLAQTMDLNAAQEEAEVNYAVGAIDFGKRISTRSIEPLGRLDQGEKARITIVGQPFSVTIHNFQDSVGKVICWKGQCCKQDPNPAKARYCIPVMVYATMPGDPRTPLPQGKSELRLMILWNGDTWMSLADTLIDKGALVEGKVNDGVLANIDFIITGEGTYGDLDIRATNDSFRPQYQDAVNKAIEQWNNIGMEKAMTTVGRKLNDEKLLKLTQVAVPPTMQEYNMQDVINM